MCLHRAIVYYVKQLTIYIYIYIAMDINVLPSASRGLLSAPETENGMGSSGGTKEYD